MSKKKKDFKEYAASAGPAKATGACGFTLTNSYKHEAAYRLQKKRQCPETTQRQRGEKDQTGMFTAVEYCSEDNMDRQAFTGV